MKKYINIVLSCIILLGVTSCNDWLDMHPSTAMVDEGNSIKLLTDVNARLNGVYSQIRNYQYYGGRMMYYGDVCGEDMQSTTSTKASANYYQFSYIQDNAPSAFWSVCYSIIKNCNIILSGIDAVEVKTLADQTKLADYKGQTLTIRALAYFDLTRLYGYPYTKDDGASLAVPYVKQPVEASYKPKRNTVAELYGHIIDDLTEAATLLGVKINNGHFTKWGALSLLSRVYLYKGDNLNALQAAEAAIDGAEANGVTLWTNADYKTAWATEFSGEVLFEIQNTTTANEADGIGRLVASGGLNDLVLSDDWLVKLMGNDITDVRYSSVLTGTNGYRYLFKYPVQAGESASTYALANVKVLRLSETYLIAAEAAVKLGDNTNAVKYLNPISTRGLAANTFATVTLDDVLTERRKELVGEGHRFFDALRNGRHIIRSDDNAYPHLPTIQSAAWNFDWSYFKVVLAVPIHEIDANENLREQQNPGYDS